MSQVLGERTFSGADQEYFARLSGDRNPIHMDAIVARRTQAGAPVVHSIHVVAWFIDLLGAAWPGTAISGSLKIRFDKLVYVGDRAAAVLIYADEKGFRGEIRVDGTPMARIAVQCAAHRPAPASADVLRIAHARPLDLGLEEMAGRAGSVAPAVAVDEIATAFPAAAALLGPVRLAGLLCSTYVVGMVCPGLHSIYGGLSLATCQDDGAGSAHFRVTAADPRFRMVRMEYCGLGLSGTLQSFARQPPVQQATLETIRGRLAVDEFHGRSALIIGGSRGLGELTAKIIAAGGGDVTITYARGVADAERVVADIAAAGGTARAVRFDVTAPCGPQLTQFTVAPDSLYYMATPPIFRRKTAFFEPERFADFLRVYVTGFWEICAELRARRPDLAVFYPSSEAVKQRPADMTEYAMSKAAGELLCNDARAALKPIHIVTARLPRLPTDTTATLQQMATADPLDVMLPLIRVVERRGEAIST